MYSPTHECRHINALRNREQIPWLLMLCQTVVGILLTRDNLQHTLNSTLLCNYLTEIKPLLVNLTEVILMKHLELTRIYGSGVWQGYSSLFYKLCNGFILALLRLIRHFHTFIWLNMVTIIKFNCMNGWKNYIPYFCRYGVIVIWITQD